MSTAISFVFSMTIMISEIRMLSAATKTIRPMVMKVTTRSRRRARNRGLFCSIQLVAMKPWLPVTRSAACSRDCGNFAGQVDVVELELDDRDHVAQAEQLLRVGRGG